MMQTTFNMPFLFLRCFPRRAKEHTQILLKMHMNVYKYIFVHRYTDIWYT